MAGIRNEGRGVTPKRSRTSEEAQARIPTDEHLWKDLCQTWDSLASKTGLGVNTLAKYLHPRGWKRKLGKIGGWSHAPCELCGASFEIQVDQRQRRCPDHVGVDALPEEQQTEYQKELEAYLERCAQGKASHLRRPHSEISGIQPHELEVVA